MVSKIPGIASEEVYTSTENDKIKFTPQVMEVYYLMVSKSGAKYMSEKYWAKGVLQGHTTD